MEPKDASDLLADEIEMRELDGDEAVEWLLDVVVAAKRMLRDMGEDVELEEEDEDE